MKRTFALGILGAIAAALVLLAGCARPGEERCQEACLHYSKLRLDDLWAPKLAAALSDEERAQLERDKATEWEDVKTNPERGLGACVAACNRPTRGGIVDCILAAETFAQAKDCDDH